MRLGRRALPRNLGAVELPTPRIRGYCRSASPPSGRFGQVLALEQERERFYEALRDAHTAGASFALIGQIVGPSRQRVAQIVEAE